jgi:hypothetical protein
VGLSKLSSRNLLLSSGEIMNRKKSTPFMVYLLKLSILTVITNFFHGMIHVFAGMPIPARGNCDLLSVHGGITPDLPTLEQIRGITRPLHLNQNEIGDAPLGSDLKATGTSKRSLNDMKEEKRHFLTTLPWVVSRI